MTLEGKTDADKLKSLSQQSYKNQAIWFLNAFWLEFEQEAEKLWQYVDKIQKIDLQKGAEGNEVDEMQMHRYLEAFSETMTVREMRDTLRSKGAISDSVKLVALVHYLIFRYQVDFHILVNASQGDNQKEIQEAQRKLDAVQDAYQESEKRSEQAKKALTDSKTAEAQAKAREAESKVKAQESKVKEEESHVAKQELEVALKEVKEQEDAFNNKTADLQRKSAEGSVVAQNKAKNELAQHLASDPLPLRKAKITQEAAVKKADRATKLAADARIAAEAAIVEAEKATVQAGKAREASEEATREAEAAVDAMQGKLDEAEAFLNSVKAKPGKAMGTIWFMERELHEKKKFMPERKGGIKKN